MGLLACGAGPPSQPVRIVPGSYATDTVRNPEGSSLLHTLTLRPDSSAVLESSTVGGTRQTRSGVFTATGPNLTVTFVREEADTPAVFRWRLIQRRLVPVEWDRAVYGPAGLTLHLR